MAEIPGNADGKIDILQALSTWLTNENNGSWLLILDNVDDASVLLDSTPNDIGNEALTSRRCLLDFLPRVEHGKVLITTRDRSCALKITGYRGTPLEVLSMSSNESVELLRVYLPEAGQEEAFELVQELEHVPLAISQAGAYIKEVPRVLIPRYLSLFRENNESQVALLNKNKKDLRRDPGVPNAVITSWELSFTQIRNMSPRSADALSLMTFFHRQAIPKSLIQGDADDVMFEEDLNVLLNFSLIRAETQRETFEMHRLVQIAMRHWLGSEKTEQFWKMQAIERVAHQFPAAIDQDQHWPECEALTSHADEVLFYATDLQESELNKADILIATAWYLTERKWQNALARQRCENALQIQRRYFVNDSDHILDSLEILAATQRRLGKMEEAKNLQEVILRQRLERWGDEDRASLTTMHNLALSYMGFGQYDKTEDLMKRVVESQERLFGQEDSQVLISEDVLAEVLIRQDKLKEAEERASRLVDVCTRKYGLEHLGTLNAMLYLSRAFLQQDRPREAENLIAKAIPFFTKIFGSFHHRTLDARRLLSISFLMQGKLDEAKELCRSSLGTAQEVLGRGNDITRNLVQSLGLIYQKQGHLSSAPGLLKENVDFHTETKGDDHPETLTSKFDLAFCYKDMGDRDEAIQLITEVYRKRREVLRENHPKTIMTAEYLAFWKSEDSKTKEDENEEEGEEHETKEMETDVERSGGGKSKEDESEEGQSEDESMMREQSIEAQLSPSTPQRSISRRPVQKRRRLNG